MADSRVTEPLKISLRESYDASVPIGLQNAELDRRRRLRCH